MPKRIEQRIIDYLKRYAFGRDNAIPSQQIVRDLGITDRDLRDYKGRIVKKYGIPIGSTGMGYFYAANDLEIMNFRNEYHSRGASCFSMSKAYEQIVAEKDQLSMI